MERTNSTMVWLQLLLTIISTKESVLGAGKMFPLATNESETL